MMPLFKTNLIVLLASATVVCSISAVAVLGATGGELVVSQKNRLFNPLDVVVAKDHSIIIFNDDGDLLHHAYIESDDFNFDSGDQQPGSRTRITFPVRGDFKVLCGIHPKMKLVVHVK